MCRVLVIEFFIENVRFEEFKDKRVLEVGSRYVNGSVRPFIERFLKPREYIGIDIEPGKFVDLVLPTERVVEHFGRESFDVVIATELLEHVKDWRLVITNFKEILKRGGYIYITTVKRGFPYHGYPYDFWRYELTDMRKIFSDFEIMVLKSDPEHGVLLKARKPIEYKPNSLDNISLYSIILGKRIKDIPNLEDAPLARRLMFKILSSKVKWLLPGTLVKFLERYYLT